MSSSRPYPIVDNHHEQLLRLLSSSSYLTCNNSHSISSSVVNLFRGIIQNGWLVLFNDDDDQHHLFSIILKCSSFILVLSFICCRLVVCKVAARIRCSQTAIAYGKHTNQLSQLVTLAKLLTCYRVSIHVSTSCSFSPRRLLIDVSLVASFKTHFSLASTLVLDS